MATKLDKYRAEVPASLQTCITAVLANDAAALATHAGDGWGLRMIPADQ